MRLAATLIDLNGTYTLLMSFLVNIVNAVLSEKLSKTEMNGTATLLVAFEARIAPGGKQKQLMSCTFVILVLVALSLWEGYLYIPT